MLPTGTVNKVKLSVVGQDDLIFAMKVIDTSHKKADIDSLRREIEALEKIVHKNVVKLMEHFMIDATMYIVMEYADVGTLSGHLQKKSHPLSEGRATRWFFEMV